MKNSDDSDDLDDKHESRTHRRKRDLPFPYDQDLSGILPRLNRRTGWGRTRLANHRVTASLLAAGMRLLEQHFGPCAERPVTSKSLLLGPLSQRCVGEAFGHNPEPFARHGDGAGLLRDRWTPYSNFVVDLINFAVWKKNYPPEFRTRRATNTRRLVRGRDGRDFVRAVHDIAHRHTTEGRPVPGTGRRGALRRAPPGGGLGADLTDETPTTPGEHRPARRGAAHRDCTARGRVRRYRGPRHRPRLPRPAVDRYIEGAVSSTDAFPPHPNAAGSRAYGRALADAVRVDASHRLIADLDDSALVRTPKPLLPW
ncbi:hypothetical protein ACFVXC_17495 [Streptomyces sp. NPDC058257]|uniref:hypothetical protein n=1 Tax=Streptomyces sp. NPDC058257 TaxID=3346409 RepID=UPI0036E31036